jgi:hypothetical protein
MEDLVLQYTEPTPLSKEARKAELRRKLASVKVPEPKLRVLSLGWGVQSFTLAAMSALGELPKLDLLIHADTSWERQATYKFAEKYTPWLEAQGLSVASACSLSSRKPEKNSTSVNIPAYFIGRRGAGQLRRQCTSRWKIAVVYQLIRQELAIRGIKKTAGVVEQWLGISWDEATRAKNSPVQYIQTRHPFLEAGTRMTRQDCVKWLQAHDLEVPVKSSCTHCVYHNQKNWEALKREGGPDWEQALYFDSLIRNASTKIGLALYIHPSRKPLIQSVPLPEDIGYSASEMFDGAGCDMAGYCWD